MKFIHTSDWHFDNRFKQFTTDEKENLNRARFTTLRALLIYARKKGIELILVGGDQFDNGFTVSKDVLLEMLSIIKEYNEISFIMITGNHDPMTDTSVYKKIDKNSYPENLILIEDKKEILLEKYNCKIFAASLKSKFGNYNPLEWIDDKKEDMFKIGLAHGSIMINNKYNPDDYPIELDFSNNKNLDYLALGHYHTFLKCNDRTFYCGTHEQQQAHDTFYALEIELEKGRLPDVKKIENINQYIWLKKELSVDDTNYLKTLDSINEIINRKTIIELKTQGYLSIENFNKFNEKIVILLSSCFKYFLDNKISLIPTEDEINRLNADGYIKKVIEKLLSMKSSDESLPIFLNQNLDQNDIINNALLKIYDNFKN